MFRNASRKWLIHNLQIVTKPTDHFSRPYRSDGANYYPYFFFITTNKMQRFLVYLFLKMLCMFQAVPPPIIRSTELYIQLQILSTNTAACCYRRSHPR